ncbi:MAG: Abi family protein [Lachnospiraceae bacterium]|nr:Abi family protein [Lachnospiraceae bacterium]
MANIELPITLEEQVIQMKKYVSFRQRKKMREFVNYAGYFRASRYGKFLLSRVGVTGAKSKQDTLFALYKFDVELRRILSFYCNRAEVRFKSALSNACSIKLNSGTFYLDKQSYTPSQGEKDAKKRKQNITFFNNHLYKDILGKEEKLRKDVRKYPELKEYRKGGNRQKNKLPVWVAFSYFELGTVTMMYNYLRGDLRKAILAYSFGKTSYAKRDTEVMDTWLDAVRNLRNYCAHNSMLVGMTSSVVLLDSNDDATLLQADNDLFSRIYALKKLIPTDDIDNMKNDIKKLIKKTPVDVFLLGILSSNWEEIYDRIVVF